MDGLRHCPVRHREVGIVRVGREKRLQAQNARCAEFNPMKIFNFLHVTLAQAFYRWAMHEINPMHPDVPRILRRQRELADKANRLFA
jgi:hypothetical protein